MAGLLTAIFLKRAKKDVLVLEQKKPPGFKPCGGGVTPRAMRLFKKFNIDMGPCTPVFVMENNSPPWHYNRSETKMAVMNIADRQLIDQAVLGAAIKEGVKIKHARVSGFDYTKGKFKVKTTCGDFFSQILVGADGATSLTRRAFGAKVPHYARAIMIRSLETTRCSDSIIFDGGYVNGGYGWVFPIGENTVNAGIYVIGKYGPKNLRDVLSSYIKDRLEIISAPCPVTGGVIPWGGHTRPAPGVPVLLIGDAGGFADPLTGEGIYHAIYTAYAAANAIISSDFRYVRLAYYRNLLGMRLNTALLRMACPRAHTPHGARVGGRIMGKRFIYGPVAEGMLRGFSTSATVPGFPFLLAMHFINPKIKSHARRAYMSLADHAKTPWV